MTAQAKEAQAELRARLGAGARYDATSAPHADLLTARRGAAYFARLLNALGDPDFDKIVGPTHQTRRHVIAHVSYHARGLAEWLADTRSGQTRALPTQSDLQDQITQGASLPPRALRSLFQHTDVHLNVEWRDLSDAHWNDPVLLSTPLIHAACLWRGALELDAGGRQAEVPPGVVLGPPFPEPKDLA